LKVRIADPPLAAKAMRDQVTSFDPAADRLGRNLQVLCGLRDGQKGGKAAPDRKSVV
jgi:hypothetical protein